MAISPKFALKKLLTWCSGMRKPRPPIPPMQPEKEKPAANGHGSLREGEKKGEEPPKATTPKESTPTKYKNPLPPSPVTQRTPSAKTPSPSSSATLTATPKSHPVATSPRPRPNDNQTSKTLMDTSLNLKRRRDSGEGLVKKKLCKDPKPQPQQQPQQDQSPTQEPVSHQQETHPTLPQIQTHPTPPQTQPTPPQNHPTPPQKHSINPPLTLPEPFHSLPLPSLSLSLILIVLGLIQRTGFNTKQATHGAECSHSLSPNKDNIQESVALCSLDLEAISDFQLRKTLKPLLDQEKYANKCQIHLTLGLHPWWSPSSARLAAEPRVCGYSWRRLAKPTLAWGWWNWSTPPRKKMLSYCAGRVPIYVLQSFKGAVPHWCWRSVQGWPSYEWTRHRLPETGRWYFHPEDFRTIVDTELVRGPESHSEFC